MIPCEKVLLVLSSALSDLPMTRALLIYAVPSMVTSVSENSIPAIKLSATLKFSNLTSPTFSAIAPTCPFLKLVKLIKWAVIRGFYQYGSVTLGLASKIIGEQGLVRGIRLWKILNPYLPFEWATLFVNSPS